jgi:hypothetical protein
MTATCRRAGCERPRDADRYCSKGCRVLDEKRRREAREGVRDAEREAEGGRR